MDRGKTIRRSLHSDGGTRLDIEADDQRDRHERSSQAPRIKTTMTSRVETRIVRISGFTIAA